MSTMMQTGHIWGGTQDLISKIEEEEEKDVSIDEFVPGTPVVWKLNSGVKVWKLNDHA